eukprot:173747-Chlamydomonas_euryale.AAC.1
MLVVDGNRSSPRPTVQSMPCVRLSSNKRARQPRSKKGYNLFRVHVCESSCNELHCTALCCAVLHCTAPWLLPVHQTVFSFACIQH